MAEVAYRARIKDRDVAVTDRSLVIREHGRMLDITLSHIESVELVEAWRVFLTGCLLILTGLMLLWGGSSLQDASVGVALTLLILGAAVARYGWNNRYVLKIHTLRRTVKLRNGTDLKPLYSKIREQVLTVRLEQGHPKP